MCRHRYTAEQIEYIKKIASDKPREEIQKLFNDRYNTNVTKRSIEGIMQRNKIKNHMKGYTTRFEKGQTYKPIGSESVHAGIIMKKIAEPDSWVKKHIWLWKQHYGEVPEDYYVHFKDNNKLNCTIENLYLVRKGVFSAVRRKGLQSDNPDINLAVHKIEEINFRIRDLIGG